MGIILLTGLLGWVIGALVNYLADVLPRGKRIRAPFCTACGANFTLQEYFLLHSRCKSCQQARSRRTWVIEIFFIITTMLMYAYPPEQIGFWGGAILLGYFGVVVVIDMELRVILHIVSLFGAIMGLVLGTIAHGLVDTLIGGLVGFGTMWIFYLVGALILRFIRRKRGGLEEEVALGFGDVNLAGVLGLILGWPAIWVGLIYAILLGGIISFIYLAVMLLTRRYQLFSALPYGPFLIAGTSLIVYFRNILLNLLERM